MSRGTPAEIAAALERTPARRLAHGAAWLAERLVGRDGPTRVPHALAWRLRHIVANDPPRIAVHGTNTDRSKRQLLLVSNDLSRSGAPQLLVEIAQALLADGDAVTVAAPTDGALRLDLIAAGAAVVIDPSLRDPASPLLTALAAAADAALCNTIDTAAAVTALAPAVPLIWYVHEVSLLERRLADGIGLDRALALPARLWAGSELSAALLRPVRPDVEVVPYGLEPLAGTARAVGMDRPLRLVVMASYEPRKGQDLLLDALALLATERRGQVRVVFHGRVLFADFYAGLRARLAGLPEATLGDALDADGYRAAMLACDAVVIPSRDDTLPLVSLDALGAGRVLICTATTGTAAYLEDGRSGFVAAEPTARSIADALDRAIARAADWPEIAEAGRAVFTGTFAKPVFARRIRETLAAITQTDAATS